MVVAFVLATTKDGKEKEVLDELAKLSEVKEAWNVYGDYDVFMRAETTDLDRLNEFLINKVRSVPNIAMTTTMIGL